MMAAVKVCSSNNHRFNEEKAQRNAQSDEVKPSLFTTNGFILSPCASLPVINFPIHYLLLHLIIIINKVNNRNPTTSCIQL